MESHVIKFIDNIIRDKCTTFPYEFEAQELTGAEFKKIMNFLFYYDETFREKLEEYVHLLVEERKPIVEFEDRNYEGYVPNVNRVNGEVTWRKSA